MKGERVVRSRTGLRAAAVLVAIAGLAGGRAAVADDKPTLNGSWSASGLSESWTVGDWGDACGPRPTPHGAGGGTVQIRESGGELSISGAGRSFSTAECWEQMPGLGRTSHSASGGGRFWRTHCSNAANDPRHASVTTTFQATDSTISMTETGQYQFLIHDTNCTASATRSRSYSLLHREGETPPAPSASATAEPVATAAPTAAPKPPPAPPEPKPSRCSGSPGEPARLEVHPARKLLRAGDRFVFRAVVLDGDGCPTATRPSWAIAPGPLASKASVDPAGALVVDPSADEGKLDVVASVLGKSVSVPVEVASAEHYDALLASSGLDPAGEQDSAAVAVIAAGTIGGRTAVAEDAAGQRKTLFLAIVIGLAAALGFAGLVLSRRGRRAEGVPDEVSPESMPMPISQPPPSAPLSSRLEPEAPPPPSAPPAAEKPRKKPASRGKICPTCGDRYEGEAEFCGKDATKLVLLN